MSWFLFAVYVLVTAYWARKGWSKTSGFKSFALAGDLGPWVVGITLAASIASTATFVINPGFVYTSGLSALFHFGVAAPGGFLLALWLFSGRFRTYGQKWGALTLPQWIGERYQSNAMRLYFAIINLLLSTTFIVLIIKGSALIMQSTLGLDYISSLVVIVGFVFSYVFFGGTYAHAYTNTFQGALMILVAIAMVGKGLPSLFNGELLVALQVKGNGLLDITNAQSAYFSNFYEVFVAAFVISMGLVCQPHILMKPLYLKSDTQVSKALWITAGVSLFYASILLVGLFAHVGLPAIGQQDAVVALYVQNSFGEIMASLISIALLAAGMSTLDGILVGVSTIAANDIAMNPLFERKFSDPLKLSRWILIAVGIVSFVIALDPPKLVGIFAQVGIYGLTAASLAPVLLGLYMDSVDSKKIFLSSVVGATVHFVGFLTITYYFKQTINPAVTASFGIYASFLLFAPEIFQLLLRRPVEQSA